MCFDLFSEWWQSTLLEIVCKVQEWITGWWACFVLVLFTQIQCSTDPAHAKYILGHKQQKKTLSPPPPPHLQLSSWDNEDVHRKNKIQYYWSAACIQYFVTLQLEKLIKVMMLMGFVVVAVWDTFGSVGVAVVHMAYTGILPAVSQSWHCFTLSILWVSW